MKLGCVILAGGKSSRMGKDKALLFYKDLSFAERLMSEFSFFEEKFLARGNHSDCGQKDWKTIRDCYPEQGPLAGIHAALSICESDALFVISCDMPLANKTLAELFLNRLYGEEDVLLAVTCEGTVHPLCGFYKKTALPVLEEQLKKGNNRVMEAVKRVKAGYLILTVEESRQLLNVNRPQDYELLKSYNI